MRGQQGTIAYIDTLSWFNVVCTYRDHGSGRDTVAIGKPSGMCTKLRTVPHATIEITCRDHSVIACSRHLYMGVVLHAHSVRGEPRIQPNDSGELATTILF